MRLRSMGIALVLAVYGVCAGLMVRQAQSTYSLTFDEPLYIGVGDFLWRTGHYDVDALWYNGPVSYYINSLFFPGLGLGPEHYAYGSGTVHFAKDKGLPLLLSNAYPQDHVLQLSRLPFIFTFWALVGLVYLWSSALWGMGGGLFSSGLVAFCPNLLAHSSVATMDLTVTLFMTASVYAFWRWTLAPTRLRLCVWAAACALALASKPSAVALGPVFVVLGVVTYLMRVSRPSVKTMLSHGGLALLVFVGVVWALYGFQTETLVDPSQRPHETLDRLTSHLGVPQAWIYFFAEHIPIPFKSFWTMLAITPMRLAERPIYFMGETALRHVVAYFPTALIMKSTLAASAAAVLSAGLYLQQRRRPGLSGLCVLVPPTLFMLMALTQQNTLGLRYVLPVLPFIYVASGAFIAILRTRVASQALRWGLPVALLVGHAASTVRVSPHLLSYFNEAVGGPAQGWRYLVDSDLDWGQDLKALKSWMQTHNVPSVKLGYFSMFDPKDYGIAWEPLPCEPTDGVLAMSLTLRQMRSTSQPKPGSQACLAWLKDHKPTARLGYGMVVYDFRKRPPTSLGE